VVEHVADLPGFLEACAELIRPGGTFFAATLNRTAASYLLAIVAGSLVTGVLYALIKQSEAQPLAVGAQ
jgi:2-polyprenyl-6-hydroxyphenyl methylase/3-demethylubiquinone-9 3-methyltransferase